jgi:hypothetical protein
MSNSPQNREQDALFEQTPTQLNPGAAHPSDFPINLDRGPGQEGDTAAERAKLLAEADADDKSRVSAPIPVRNEVPHHRHRDD